MPMNGLDCQTDNYFLPDFSSPRAVFLLVIVAELFVLVLVLAWTGQGRFDWNSLALTSLFVQWVVLFSAAVIRLCRPLLKTAHSGVISACCLFICLAVTTVFTSISLTLFDNLSLHTLAEPSASFWTQHAGLLLRNNLIALIICIILLRYFYLSRELQRQQQAELTARIQSLQSRIQPHFLFNCMNTIASLISTRPEQAEEVVEDLSNLFRASLNDASVLTSIESEIALARQYLNIENLRLGTRLRVEWHIPEQLQPVDIPRLIFQPLLENAITHGIQPDADNGQIIIRVDQNHSQLRVSIKNTLPEKEPASTQGNNMALINITDRLKAHYQDQGKLVTRSNTEHERRWYEALLCIPNRSPKPAGRLS